MVDLSFYKGKRVLVTGHTGFKGSWLCKMLSNYGAKVTGYSLGLPTDVTLYDIAGIRNYIELSIDGDIRDYDFLKSVFEDVQPEIVFHLAAQPLVREAYKNPINTYSTNVMGTVNIFECIRTTNCVRSFINVTTDKVYFNREWLWGYRESDELKGYDPYSNSKSCSELITYSYINSYFSDSKVSISTMRAGNVIGGGDFALDRIIPDCIRAAMNHKDIIIRNPYSIRPYQHVLEPLYVYLQIGAMQYIESKYAGAYNVGPDYKDCVQTGVLVDLFINKWGEGVKWLNKSDNGPHEAGFLKLDNSKLKHTLGWAPHWDTETAVDKVVQWSKCWIAGHNVSVCMDKQIEEFLSL